MLAPDWAQKYFLVPNQRQAFEIVVAEMVR